MKIKYLAALGILSLAGSVHADTLLSQDYSTFTTGALVGQGGWVQLGTIATNPIQVASGAITMANSGQDVATPFAAVSSGDLTVTFTLNLSAAQAGGDYFLAFDTSSTATNYNSRLFAKSSGSGYVLGLQMGITGATPVYGTTELAFGSIYTITLTRTFVAGAANDTGFVNVDGSSYTGLVTWAGTSGEDASLAAIALRQGSAGSAATIAGIGSMTVTTSAVPEPGTVALMGLGLGAVLFGARRRRA
ncbi:MAG TPA: PEP-CTERM sorting domain-containing protein [Chthoniobacterales bacterium]|nr:PEP-CTERM sorting domain-containing protein [Chthoniobacterales bacterium]